MDNLVDIAEFTAESLSPRLPESSQVNPEVYGAELAFWLATELARENVATSYPHPEDWGWYVDYASRGGAKFAVHCGNVGGATDRWFIQLRRFGRKLFGRDKPAYSEAEALISAIRLILEGSSSVSELDWHYSDIDAA